MTDVIDINANRAPVVYSVTIAHHYDGTLEFKIEDVADDERSREAVLHAFRRISGADAEIAKLVSDLKTAVWSDSQMCKDLEKDNTALRARIAELEAALKAARDIEQRVWIDALLENLPEEKAVLFRAICLSAEKIRAASAALEKKND